MLSYKILALLFPSRVWTVYESTFLYKDKNIETPYWKTENNFYKGKRKFNLKKDWRVKQIKGKRKENIFLGYCFVWKFPIERINYI